MTPLIILGAGRSGTNALRNAICSLPGFHTWPCDEINYIWRQGNRAHPTDQFGVDLATPDAIAGIRRAFERRQAVAPSSTVVEKTCANTLRVEFVDRVLPEALLVHIVRDGRDVVASAVDRWTAPLDIPYILRKARYVPAGDLPYYAGRYAATRLARLRSSDDRLSWWGPRFDRADQLDAGSPLAVVAANQWSACVLVASRQLQEIDDRRRLRVEYRDLVSDPAAVLTDIATLAGREATREDIARAAGTVRGGSVGAWRSRLGADDLESIAELVDRTHSEIGYVP